MLARLLLGRLVQRAGRVLEFLVLEQLANQLEPRVGDLVVILLRRRRRQQHPRLDLHERRGQHEEVADRFRIELLDQLNALDELSHDPRDRNLADVDLFAADQKQKQVQRTVVDIECDFVVGHRTDSFDVIRPQASRTSAMTPWATERACRPPLRKTSST